MKFSRILILMNIPLVTRILNGIKKFAKSASWGKFQLGKVPVGESAQELL